MSETIADIVREMRERDNECGNGWLEHFADRIEAAAARRRCVCDDSCEQFRELERENERLRAALMPVMEFDENAHQGLADRVAMEAVAKLKEGVK